MQWVSGFDDSVSIETVYDLLPVANHYWLSWVLLSARLPEDKHLYADVKAFQADVLMPVQKRLSGEIRVKHEKGTYGSFTDAIEAEWNAAMEAEVGERWAAYKAEHKAEILKWFAGQL